MRLVRAISDGLEMQGGAHLRPAEDGFPYSHTVNGDRIVAIAGCRACDLRVGHSVEEREVPPQHLRLQHGGRGEWGGAGAMTV
jgi:hypothetical protein